MQIIQPTFIEPLQKEVKIHRKARDTSQPIINLAIALHNVKIIGIEKGFQKLQQMFGLHDGDYEDYYIIWFGMLDNTTEQWMFGTKEQAEKEHQDIINRPEQTVLELGKDDILVVKTPWDFHHGQILDLHEYIQSNCPNNKVLMIKDNIELQTIKKI